MTYREMYQNLFNAHVVSLFYLKSMQPLYPKWYDANAQCEYHAGITGHSIENCTVFKKLIERFIKIGFVKFDDSSTPNVAENPLPNHIDQGVNGINEGGRKRVKQEVVEVKTPLKWVWKEMVKRGSIVLDSKEESEEKRNYCEFHNEAGHEIQECGEFRAIVQDRINNKEMKFYEEVKSPKEGNICALEGESMTQIQKVNYQVVIFSRLKNNEAGARMPPKVIIQKPIVFFYKDSKRVPWNYYCNVTISRKENLANASKEDQGVDSYTRNRRWYDSESKKAKPAKGKAIMVKQKKKRTTRPEPPVNKPVNEEEAKKFLKFLKHSEYSVVEQLRKQPAHRLVSNISTDNFIFFNDDEILPGGMGSTKALHITTCYKGYTLLVVLIDNGSTLNVLPLSTLNRLPVDSSHMKACQNIVKTFDGTERRALDTFCRGSAFITPPKVEIGTEGRLVTINAEEDIIAAVTSDIPYLEANDEATKCSFRSLKFMNATFITEGNRIPMPKISKTTRMGLQLTIRKGALPKRGLERHLQGRVEALILKDKQDRLGL
ncbi:uncharacterized protein LOC108455410 [Gossypium arboreum]|uniref:uncharacterized protein LOC108455410 n=1 Tax=Gossypium arboreum TaxID=29729 RepID=UPI0008191112|nr:uncharacterized protein LOC108455410 [Gossypium arboreum]